MAAGQSAGAGGWGLPVVNSIFQWVGATVSLGSVVAWLKANLGPKLHFWRFLVWSKLHIANSGLLQFSSSRRV